ncbi:MAG TPA: hypothetical protein EYH46_05560 [Sulfurivirga caldicuralii]|nr:hypothetical protein [Sulfurivirga caldicuralii]
MKSLPPCYGHYSLAVSFTMPAMIARYPLLFLLACVLGFHLWLNVLLPLGVDEAHYALYGWYLDWSYYDHPPLIGWLEAPFVQGLDGDWAVRLPAIAIGLVSLWSLVRTSERLFPDTAYVGGWVLFLALFSPLLHGLTLTPLPDTPLLLLSLLLMGYLWHHRHSERLPRPWILGVLLGLAGLSKYTAITLVVSLLLVVAVYGRWGWLKQPGMWVGAGIALVLLSPVLWWNAQHDWASFLYQLHHGTRHQTWSFERFAISQGRQLGAYGPVIYVAGMALIGWALFRWRTLPEGVRFSLLFALPVLVLFAWSAGHEPILPHWTGLGWWLLLPALGWWLARHRWVLWLHGMLGGVSGWGCWRYCWAPPGRLRPPIRCWKWPVGARPACSWRPGSNGCSSKGRRCINLPATGRWSAALPGICAMAMILLCLRRMASVLNLISGFSVRTGVVMGWYCGIPISMIVRRRRMATGYLLDVVCCSSGRSPGRGGRWVNNFGFTGVKSGNGAVGRRENSAVCGVIL